MIHFRRRRPSRPAVNFLTLRSIVSSAASGSPSIIFSELHANAPAIAHPSSPLVSRFSWIFSPIRWVLKAVRLPLPSDPYLNVPRRASSSQRILSTRVRRYLAFAGLVLALSLEVSGCDAVRYAGLALGPVNGEHAARDPAQPEQALSFYDPADLSGTPPLSLASLPTGRRSVPAEAKPVPWAIPESVYFLYRGRQTGDDADDLRLHQSPLATAFVLSVPSREHNRDVRFLVTARHVVDPQWAHCAAHNPDSVDVRLNRWAGGVDYETVSLHTGTVRNFYTPTDTTADIAIIPFGQTLIAHLDIYKFIDVPFRLLPTDADMRLIRADQPVMTARLSTRPSGISGNFPVFDAGSLSKMPAEPVSVQCGIVLNPQIAAKLLHVWFINAGVPQGVSGAPVYTSIARGPGNAKSPVLLGIQSVAWPDKGVAGITPSPVLGDLVRSALSGSKLNLDFYRGPGQ